MSTDNVIPVAFAKPTLSSILDMSVVELERFDTATLQELLALVEITGWVLRGVVAYKAVREAASDKGKAP